MYVTGVYINMYVFFFSAMIYLSTMLLYHSVYFCSYKRIFIVYLLVLCAYVPIFTTASGETTKSMPYFCISSVFNTFSRA